MKKVYVFTTSTKEEIESYLNEDRCFISLKEDGDADVLVVCCESFAEAMQEMKDTERVTDAKYKSMITHRGRVAKVGEY